MSEAGFAPVIFEPITRDELNAHLVLWGHRMGEVRRPTRGWSHGLRYKGRLLAVVSADTLIRERVGGLTRFDAIELSRLCAARSDLCRVALRLWRSFVFPAIAAARGCRWAISYQDAALHSGNLYRFDGWVPLGRSRSGTDSRSGRPGRRKVIWGWCDNPQIRRNRTLALPTGTTSRPPVLDAENGIPAGPFQVIDLANVDESIYIIGGNYLHGGSMPINVNNPEADALTRRFAHMAGVSITDAIVIAMKEAIERRRVAESPLQTAARLREKHGVNLSKAAKKPLPREAFDKMWDPK